MNSQGPQEAIVQEYHRLKCRIQLPELLVAPLYFLENWQFGAWAQVKDVVKLWNKTSQRRPNFFRNICALFLKKKEFRWMENLPYLDSVFTCYQLNIFIHAPYVAKQMSLQKGNFYKRISFVCCSCSARTLPGCSIQRLQAFESLQKEGKHGGK